MSAQVRVELGLRSATVFGAGAVVIPAMKAARIPRQWSDRRHAWQIPVDRVDDLTAVLEHQVGADVELVEATP